ncbi:flowering locus K homology domain isoform X1 [Selaginella moellendorffii]|uniref:flowering locus K homology domain isoform X1 n=2 Tax=Selaginella moellendorffii TaxID=88036 RepID=UPI000D1CC6FC|nr:flowering locus K homology domain isoform X1 [Selaginella moellendorffii]XP_024518654.1 flowering locus K homology domain isoform X1 [Selaginella moellendorffii]XP_024518655.1 flowering locus K homology domain isoform X1 [Selaginella moellendorffii]|eukprot:XP_024518653.1 flowering locus K homology domain isoform X1 [Selaginella moellendorffii]
MAPNPSALLLAPVPNSSSSRKRHAEDGGSGISIGAGPATKRAVKTPDVLFRLLVPAGKIGKVIGKKGSQIKKLRDETGAHIKIADPMNTTEDRAVLISSKNEGVSDRSCAELALLEVVTILLKDGDGATPSAAIGPQHQGSPNLTRLLIAGSQAGSLIGKAGANIKNIRGSSSASVRVLPSDQLPLCSAACETDRLVQISGEVAAVQMAIELVAANLRDNPPKETVPTNPEAKTAYFLGIDGNTGQQVLLPHSSVAAVYGHSPSSMALYGLQPHPLAGPAYAGGVLAQAPPLYANPAARLPPMLPKVSAEMSVPSSVMGGLIGKGGFHISHMRSVSGATIKVNGSKESSVERTILFEGTQEQVNAAQSLVHAFLNGQSALPSST